MKTIATALVYGVLVVGMLGRSAHAEDVKAGAILSSASLGHAPRRAALKSAAAI